ncbi:serine/threonine-protein kinase [Treponema rectale]|uniref:Serine/threonine-protein kinase n=1 Tax=Treponema rectale TaxID=744512 RepID=A0A840SAM5_9SPIR|nr:serine/threonine-protein kinase [Treponema rectale]MBB5219759.1 serine/threonine-protein kinase [Treponema rectale]
MAVVPEVIGKYKILSVVAVGGMGTVYRALHPSLKRTVIIKKLMLKAGGQSIRERFKREAQILLDLSSPYVVRMFDYFTEGRSDYIVLEFVDGMSLDKLIERQVSLPAELSLLIFLDACYGLKHAHSKGIIHRDIKPGNILISRHGEVKLADFGIASAEKESDVSENKIQEKAAEKTVSDSKKISDSITRSGSTLGTPAYMSPEQIADSSKVDQRADIYSMGVMLYEMVTGTKPYPGEMTRKNISRIKKGEYVPPKKLDPKLPSVVCSLIKKMMQPRAERRFKNIDAVIKKIRAYLSRYDTHALRVQLAQSVISSKALSYEVMKPKRRWFSFVFTCVLTFILIAASIRFAWNEGYIHKTLLSRWYSPVTLSLKLPSTASADADLQSRAFFFVDDNDHIPEVKNTRRIFTADEKSSGAALYCSTKPVYLKPGKYRVKIASGPYVCWKNINVTGDALNVSVDFSRGNAVRKINLHTSACDVESGQDISSGTRFLILYGNSYVDLDTVNPSHFVTSNVYKFKAVHKDYEDEYFSLRLDWYQDELFINAGMKKKK